MDSVKKILKDHFGNKNWKITRPADGWEKGSYIVSSDKEKYFIKFGIIPEIMIRLSDLEITAHVIATGESNSKKYMIQEFISNTYVPKQWFGNHLKQLVDFVSIYHSDKELKRLVKTYALPERQSLESELKQMFIFLKEISGNKNYPEIKNGIKILSEKYQKFLKIEPVPIHDDPNTKNIFLNGDKLLFIDWNKIRLSDPFSDLGAILWWYVPSDKWSEIVKKEDFERIYLAGAKISMGFTLWYIAHQLDCSSAFQDFTAAINYHPNPHFR